MAAGTTRARCVMGSLLGIAAILILTAAAAGDDEQWLFDRVDRLGAHPATILGNPRVVDTPVGKAIEFDGVDDALMLDVHPLAVENAAAIQFAPQRAGRTSIGVRINLVDYFKGAIHLARFTRRALRPEVPPRSATLTTFLFTLAVVEVHSRSRRSIRSRSLSWNHRR